ncbi:MAG: phosphoglycerate mutase family protein [Bacilli bacterium]|nr:phosphoglycerate mutase family protein [Bacilli bacterium]
MIYFLRHGLDDERYIGGWSEIDLTDEGVEQVRKTIEHMNNLGIIPKHIISSGIERSNTTASILGQYYDLNIKKDYRFREQNKGELNGLLKSDASVLFPEYFKDVDIETKYPGGESLIDLYIRIKAMLDEIKDIEEDTVIVTHRGVINMLYYILYQIPLDMDKEKFHVDHASLHVFNPEVMLIGKVI